MNRLSLSQRCQMISAFVEGTSISATRRMTDDSKHTGLKLLKNLGYTCAEYHNRVVRNVKIARVQCDEIWAFRYAKDKNAPADSRNGVTHHRSHSVNSVTIDERVILLLNSIKWR
jgi:hypothetical protein